MRNHVFLFVVFLVAAVSSTCLGAPSEKVVARYTLGHNLSHVAVNRVTNTIYVTGRSYVSPFGEYDRKLSIISGSSNTIIGSVDVGIRPTGVAVDSVLGKAYVACLTSNTVCTVDEGTRALTATTPVGVEPFGVAVNGATHRVYVANGGSGSVTVLDGSTSTGVATITTGGAPRSVAVNATTDKAYVTDPSNGKVYVISGTSSTVTEIAVGGSPKGVAVNPVTNRIYVSEAPNKSSLTVINGATNAIVTTIPGMLFMDSYTGAPGIVVDSVTNRIYVANCSVWDYVAGAVMVVDGATNTLVDYILTGAANPISIAYDDVTNRLYVPGSDSGRICVMDPTTKVRVGGIGLDSPLAVGVNPTTGKVYVGNGTTNNYARITIMNGSTGAFIADVLEAASAPTDIVVHETAGKVYVANAPGKLIYMLDAVNNNWIGSLGIANRFAIRYLAINQTTNRLYGADQATSSVHVFNTADGTFVKSIPLTIHPAHMVVNPTTNKIYVGSDSGTSVAVINGATNEVVGSIAVEGPADYMAINVSTQRIFALTNPVKVINAATDTVIGSFVRNGSPQGCALNEKSNRLYLAPGASNGVSVTNLSNGAYLGDVAIAPWPRTMAINPATNRLFVTGYESSGLTSMDVTAPPGIAEAIKVLRCAGGLASAQAGDVTQFDANANGVLDVTDAVRIARAAAM